MRARCPNKRGARAAPARARRRVRGNGRPIPGSRATNHAGVPPAVRSQRCGHIPSVREDVAKPENRVNLALFSLMLVPSFRRWFLERLQLDPQSCVYPPRNQPGGRPDFVVVGANGSVLAWIEVELGGENSAQLSAYR